ncbi:MAG: NADH-quinone oxidoreductase subunit J family protein [Myxococcales bacterium]
MGKLGSLSDLLWYALAGLTVASAAGVAFSRNIIYSAFSLLGAFLGVASMYVYLAAPFVAISQILIYIGGVLVLILFAVMLTSHIRDVKISNSSLPPGPGLVGFGALAVLLGYVGGATPWKLLAQPSTVDQSAALGDAFLGTYLLPFEVISVVLLATLIGAIVIARDEKTESGRPS